MPNAAGVDEDETAAFLDEVEVDDPVVQSVDAIRDLHARMLPTATGLHASRPAAREGASRDRRGERHLGPVQRGTDRREAVP